MPPASRHTPPPHTETAAYGWSPDRMVERLDGDLELARQLAAVFISDYPRLIADTRTAVAMHSPDAVRRAAHALKGSLLNFVDDGPVIVARELEGMGREDRLDQAVQTFARLEQEVTELAAQIEHFRSGDSCGF